MSKAEKSKKKQRSTSQDITEAEVQDDYRLKPSKGANKLETSEWPLLLKVPNFIFFSFLNQSSRITTVSTPRPATTPPSPKATPLSRDPLKNTSSTVSSISISPQTPLLTKLWLGSRRSSWRVSPPWKRPVTVVPSIPRSLVAWSSAWNVPLDWLRPNNLQVCEFSFLTDFDFSWWESVFFQICVE